MASWQMRASSRCPVGPEISESAPEPGQAKLLTAPISIKKPRQLRRGFFKRTDGGHESGSSFFLACPDTSAAIFRLKSCGGSYGQSESIFGCRSAPLRAVLVGDDDARPIGGAWSGDCSFPSITSGSSSFDAPCAVRHPLSCVHDCESF